MNLHIILIAVLFAQPGGLVGDERSAEFDLRERLATHGDVRVGSQRIAVHNDLPRFYEARGFQAAWSTHRAAVLVALIEDAANDGMDPRTYRVGQIGSLLGTEAGNAATDLDLLATDAFLTLAEHLLRGRIDPRALYGDDWLPTRRELDLAELLEEGLLGDLALALDRARPPHAEYRALRAAMARQRALASTDLPAILPAAAIEPGDRDTRVPLIRDRLLLFGDFEGAEPPDPSVLDEELGLAVRAFQSRHALQPTGIVDNETRRLMNRSPQDQARILSLNMERWRWLPDHLGNTHLLVNIPAYHLFAREDGETVLDMKAVVGRTGNRTPVLSDTLRSITFNPTWGVPRGLVAGEVFPEIRSQGVEYLTSRRFTVFERGQVVEATSVDWSQARPADYGFIQQPGPTNPMGRVKFNTTNEWDIYLHDTNNRGLLNRETRSFSAGCVRLESALDLASWMLRHWSNWQPDDIQRVLRTNRPEYVAPRDRWDIHLVYLTAWPDEYGQVHVYNDVYGHDAALARALGI